jgi:hypothetical protein
LCQNFENACAGTDVRPRITIEIHIITPPYKSLKRSYDVEETINQICPILRISRALDARGGDVSPLNRGSSIPRGIPDVSNATVIAGSMDGPKILSEKNRFISLPDIVVQWR